jgi:uncharacterized protein involved in type VI secretion and phage assembly
MSASQSRTASTDKRFFGVYSATVTNVNDDAGKEGRVKLKFHWFDEQMETEWSRVIQLFAGNGYGAFFVPEVGDEVLVAFDNGDMRNPHILGGVYNGKDKPVTYRSTTQDQKLIRTKGGCEVLLDDTQDKNRVRLKSPGGHTADLSDVDKKITVLTTGGQSVVMDDSANNVVIKAGSATVTVDSAGKVTIKGSSQIVLDSAQVSLGGSSAAHPLILGDTFLELFSSHTHNCTAPGTPSGPPVPPILPTAVLSTSVKTS